MKKILLALVLIPSLAIGAGWDETVTSPAPDDTIMINDVSQPEGSKTQYTNLQRLPVSDATTNALTNKMNLSGDETVQGVKNFASSPIVPEPTQSSEVATKNYVDTTAAPGVGAWGTITGTLSDQLDLWAALVGKVSTTGSESIDGAKTFVLSPILPTPTADSHAATKAYADAKVPTAGNVTVDGIKTFSASPIVPTPTADMQAATKKYVDDNLAYQFNTLDVTTDRDVTESEIRSNETITNFGSLADVSATFPAVSYSVKAVLGTEADFTFGACPPPGEALRLDGTTLDADLCALSPSVEGGLATLKRSRTSSGSWYYNVVSAVGTWQSEAPPDLGFDQTGVTFWWRAETAFDPAKDYSTGDTTPEYSGASCTTAAAYSGTSGLQCDAAGDNVLFEENISDIITSEEGRVGFWLRPNDLSVDSWLFRLRYDASDYFSLKLLSADNNLDFYWQVGAGQGHAYSSNDSLIEGVWQFVEIVWDTASNTKSIRVTGAEVGSDSTALTQFTGPPVRMDFGDFISLGGDNDIDHMVITKDSTKDLYPSREQENYDNSN